MGTSFNGPERGRDVTLRKCKICGNKETGWIDIKSHMLNEHTLDERLKALTENIHPAPGGR